MFVAGVPTPSLMKYSPLPCERPEITAPLNPPAERGALLVTFRREETAARLVKDSTRIESLLRRRSKSSAGDASEKEEIASMCDRWSESEVVDWDTVVNDSDSGDERIGEEGRVLTTRVLYWEEEAAEEKEMKRTVTEKMRVFWTFPPIGSFKIISIVTRICIEFRLSTTKHIKAKEARV